MNEADMPYAEEDDGPDWPAPSPIEVQRVVSELGAQAREARRINEAFDAEWREFEREFDERQESIRRLGATLWR